MQPWLSAALHTPRDPALQLPMKLGSSKVRSKQESFPVRSPHTSPEREPAPVAMGDPIREHLPFPPRMGSACQSGTRELAAAEGGTTETGTVCSKDEMKTAQKYCNCCSGAACPQCQAHPSKNSPCTAAAQTCTSPQVPPFPPVLPSWKINQVLIDLPGISVDLT